MELLQLRAEHLAAVAECVTAHAEVKRADDDAIRALLAVWDRQAEVRERFDLMHYPKTNHYDAEWFGAYEDESGCQWGAFSDFEGSITSGGYTEGGDQFPYVAYDVEPAYASYYCWLGHP